MFRSIVLKVAVVCTAVLILLAGVAPDVVEASPVAQVWDVQCAVTEPVCIMVMPDGSGTTFSAARTINGNVVDASVAVLVWLIDEHGPIGPLAGFQAYYLTIQAPDGLTRGCSQAYVAAADHDTDQQGWTQFSLAPRAGGWSQDLLEIYVVDDPASSMGSVIPPLPIYFNSPDIDGNLQIDLVDVSLFVQDYFSGSHPFRSDFVWNGTIDLADLAVMAQHFGAGCR